jgi:transketolase
MCKCAVTAEEHQIIGGLYGAVTEILAQHTPIPVFPVGMNNCFGESGKPLELMAKYHMNANAIIEAVEKVIHLK